MKGDIKESDGDNLQLLRASWSFREFQLINCPAHKRTDLASSLFAILHFQAECFHQCIPGHSGLTPKWICAPLLAGSTWPSTFIVFLTKVPLMDTLPATLSHRKTPFIFSCTIMWHFHGLLSFTPPRRRLPEQRSTARVQPFCLCLQRCSCIFPRARLVFSNVT